MTTPVTAPVIVRHAGPRAGLRPLFALAEDSPEQLDSYVEAGDVLVARLGDEVVGHLQLVPGQEPGEVELKNMAVAEDRQGRGIGRRLVLAAIEEARPARRMTVATASADVGNLRFYQRVGFRMRAIERDAFVPAAGYPEGIVVDGIPLRDRVWLDLDLRLVDQRV